MTDTEHAAPRMRYGEYLVWFMRAVALMWFAKGLMHWSLIIGLGDQPNASFADMPIATQSATVFFAVLDLVAAVGLWLAAAWGGVIWVIAAASHALLDLLMPQVFGRQMSFVIAVGALVLVYLILNFLAARATAGG